MSVIKLENLVVEYGDFRALDNVSLTIGEERVALLGPNGAGKSTLMKSVLGYLRATSGSIHVFDHPLPKEALQVRKDIGYMPEREVVSPHVSAVGFLTHCGRLFGMSRVDALERAHGVLNFVGLGENRYRPMGTYSTGMLQRAKLAQALIHDPKLLLLDEPTNGLDPEGRLEMLELIKDIATQRSVSILFSSHLLPDVEHVCNRIIMVNEGHIVRDGALSELTEKRHQTLELGFRGPADTFLSHIKEQGAQCQVLPNGRYLVQLPDSLDGPAIFNMAREQQVQIRHYEQARQTLGEAFVEAIELPGTAEAS